MKTTTTILMALALVSGSIGTTLAQNENPDPAAKAAAWAELANPVKEHREMKKMVGNWETVQKLWMAPGAPPAEFKGTARFRMAMGGRYLVQNYQCEIPEMGKFTGRGTSAFDRTRGEYVDTWIDNMNTGIMISRGKAKDEKTIELHSEEIIDPMTKKKMKFRTVSVVIDDNTHRFTMYASSAGEGESKMMEITYRRIEGKPTKEKIKKVEDKKKEK